MNDLLPRIAAEIALNQMTDGRRIAILMRNQAQFRSLGLAGEDGNLSMPMEGVFVCSAILRHSLISLSVDTLIVVGDCEPEGVKLAKEHLLRASSSPRLIVIPEIEVITGWEIWNTEP